MGSVKSTCCGTGNRFTKIAKSRKKNGKKKEQHNLLNKKISQNNQI